jgi:predicted PurR-regulated permease PerM
MRRSVKGRGMEYQQAAEANAEAARPVVDVPVNVRSIALAVLAVLASVAALHWARELLVPLLLGVIFSYALSPLVDRLVRWRVPRVLAVTALMLGIVGLMVHGVYSLRDDAQALLNKLPQPAQKVGRAIGAVQGTREGALDKVQQAAEQLEQAAQPAAKPPPQRGVTRVLVEKPRLDIRDYLWTGTLGLITLMGQIVIVVFLTFFMLISGDTFRRKLVKIAGPTFQRRRITVEMLDDISAQIQRYLVVNAFASVLVGVVTWAAYAWIGLQYAALWGVMAGVLNLVPYLGAIGITVAASIAAFVQFDSIEMGLLVLGVSFVIQTLEGYLLLPWLTSRAGRMSPVVVFVTVLAFAWLWGIWGLLLGVPLVMIIKSVCDHVDDLKSVGELLGD